MERQNFGYIHPQFLFFFFILEYKKTDTFIDVNEGSFNLFAKIFCRSVNESKYYRLLNKDECFVWLGSCIVNRILVVFLAPIECEWSSRECNGIVTGQVIESFGGSCMKVIIGLLYNNLIAKGLCSYEGADLTLHRNTRLSY